jgi:hypothetical protein
MELQVFAHTEGRSGEKEVLGAGIFNFVWLGEGVIFQEGKPQPLPAWVAGKSGPEQASEAVGRARYAAAKERRRTAASTSTNTRASSNPAVEPKGSVGVAQRQPGMQVGKEYTGNGVLWKGWHGPWVMDRQLFVVCTLVVVALAMLNKKK